MERIPVSGPWITEKEVCYVTDAVRDAWYQRELSGKEGVTLNYEPDDTKNTYWTVTAIIDIKLA